MEIISNFRNGSRLLIYPSPYRPLFPILSSLVSLLHAPCKKHLRHYLVLLLKFINSKKNSCFNYSTYTFQLINFAGWQDYRSEYLYRSFYNPYHWSVKHIRFPYTLIRSLYQQNPMVPMSKKTGFRLLKKTYLQW